MDCEAGGARCLQCLLLFRWSPRFSGLSGFRRQNRNIWFFYLFPTVLVAAVYGSAPAVICAIAVACCAAFFLYQPLYSFYVDNPLDMGELGCFIGLAVIGAKCAADLLRPAVRVPQRVRG